MQIWKPYDYKWGHKNVISKNNGNNVKMRTSVEPNKTYIVRKVLIRAINVYWIWATVSKVMSIYVKFTMTTHQIGSFQVTLA